MRIIDADALLDELPVHPDGGLRSIKNECLMIRVRETVKNAPTVGGWISVKERLPELKRFDEDGDTWLMSEPVLVATAKGVTIGYYEDDLDPKFKPGWNDREHGERIRVTHWMPLPEMPEVDK